MPTQTINLNNTTPAAPAGALNVEWQADAPSLNPATVRNVSACVPAATSAQLGVVQPDGVTVLVSGLGEISIPAATAAKLGLVQPDGATVLISPAGEISIPAATGAKLGLVQPDAATVLVSGAGVISVPAATAGAVGVVKPDNVTITVASDGTIAAAGGSGGGGGAAAFPWTVLQEAAFQSGPNNVSSFTVAFSQPLASGGATAFILLSCDGSSAVGAPPGWTVDLDVQQPTYARFLLAHKTSAGDADAVFTVSAASSFAGYFFEVDGAHVLDKSSTGGTANASYIPLPSITPSSGAVVFGVVASAGSNPPSSFGELAFSHSISPFWRQLSVCSEAVGGRLMLGWISSAGASGAAATPPPINTVWGLYAGAGIAYASFSIV